MIIISKKRIIYYITFITIITFALIAKSNFKEETMQTVALPVTNKVIVIDAGHGKPDERSTK